MNRQKLEDQGYFKRDRCGLEDNCPTRWYRYNDDGMLLCRNGHEQGVIQTQVTEEGDDGILASQGKKHKVQTPETTKKQSRVLTNLAGLDLFMGCYQNILRYQCKTLIRDKGFVSGLEDIVKGLWMLWSQRIYDKMGPLLENATNAADTDNEQSAFSDPQSSENETGDGTEAELNELNEPSKTKRRGDLPVLADSLSLCYMGLILMRASISLGEFYRWAMREEIAFVRPLRLIPKEIRRNLDTRYKKLLETEHSLSMGDLHGSLRRLCFTFHKHFQLALHDLNHTPLLLWYIEKMALPIQLHDIVEHLAKMLSITFSFPKKKPIKARHDPLPELCLVALLTIAVKMYHPLDSREIYARSVTDPAFLTFDWDQWNRAHQRHSEAHREGKLFMPGEQMYFTEKDVMGFTNDQLDAYMDWFDKTWTENLGDEGHIDVPKEIVNMFPTTNISAKGEAAEDPIAESKQFELQDRLLASTVKNMRPRAIISDERVASFQRPVHRAGSSVLRCRKKEDLPENARYFHKVLADVAGITVDNLLYTVYLLETRLQKWKRKQNSKK